MKTIHSVCLFWVVPCVVAVGSPAVHGSPAVAVLGSPINAAWNDEVQAKLQATGLFSQVDAFLINLVTPSLANLQNYDAVLVYSNGTGYQNSVQFGDNLADYVDGGGGVVVAVFANASIAFSGRFATQNYWGIIPASQTQGTVLTLGTVHEPASLLMAGVTSFNGGSSSYRSTGSVHPSAVRVADWSNGAPLVVRRDIGIARRADLNFFPPSDDSRNDFWDASTDGDLLMANALLFTAQCTAVETEACCFPDDTCQDLNPLGCVDQGGTPQEPCSLCGGVEACCDSATGACYMADRTCCLGNGDTPQGPGTSCTSPEACCLGDNTCQMLDPLCCDDEGGIPQGTGSTCEPMEACCDSVTGACAMADRTCCLGNGDTPQGLGTACSAPEACCFGDNACQMLDPLCCVDQGGTPQGSGSTCSALEACCDSVTGACYMAVRTCCLANGDTPQGPGTACSAPDGCCFGDNTCQMLDPLCCDDLGGEFCGNPETELIVNGGFETQDFSGWTLINSGSGGIVINDGTFDPPGPDGPLPPCDGSACSITFQSGPGRHTLYQEVTLPSSAGIATLSWIDEIRNHAGTFSDPNQEFRVEIWDTNNVPLFEVFSTNPGDPLLNVCTPRSFDVSNFLGQTVRVAFTQEDNLFFFNAHLDAVSLIVNVGGGGGVGEVEACCFSDDTCRLLNSVCCLDLGGTPQGPGSTCGGIQACCDSVTGACYMADRACCLANGDTPQGPGTTCSAPEACCFGDNTCQMLDPLCCVDQGGTPPGSGSTCGGIEACCDSVTGACYMTDRTCCLANGDTPQGPGTTCSAPEACCFGDNTCQMLDPLCCVDQGGTPQGPGSTCGGMEACCDSATGACYMAVRTCCLANGDTPLGPDTACGAPEACCFDDNPGDKTSCDLFGTDANGANLLRIDPADGSAIVVGSMGFPAPSLAVDPSTLIMYAGRGQGSPLLYTVDPADGSTILVGDTGIGFAAIGGMDFDANGTLFAAVNIAGDGGTGSDHLAIIEPSNANTVIIGPFGTCTGVSVPTNGGGFCTIEGIEAIAFDNDGTLWGAKSARGSAGTPGLYRINPTTGAATFVAPILDGAGSPPSGGIVSLKKCNCDGKMYGGTARAISSSDGGRVVVIDLSSGMFAFVGAVSATGGSSLGGLAAVPSCPQKCQMLNPLCCVNQGGTPEGPGSTCGGIEACCDSVTQECYMADRTCCLANGDTPLGPGTACTAPEACCFGDNTCQMFDPVCCVNQGGTPQGPGSTCGGVEACCDSVTGACYMADRTCCLANGDTPQGPGTTCSEPEACCLGDNTCQMLDPLCCVDQGGTPQGPGSTCGGMEACCDSVTDACYMADRTCCLANGDTPQGPGTACTTPAACCFADNTCQMLDPHCCVTQGGTPQGPGSTCGGIEACCDSVSGACYMADRTCCLGNGDIPQGPGTACTVPEACCFGDNTCQMLDPLCCVSQDGTPQGPGSTCGGIEACCDSVTGACYMGDRTCCLANGDTPNGPGSVCTAPAACCLSGTCEVLDPLCCILRVGVPQAPGTTCGECGSCCLADKDCLDDIVDATCLTIGGSFNGLGSICLGDSDGDSIDDQCDNCIGVDDAIFGTFLCDSGLLCETDADCPPGETCKKACLGRIPAVSQWGLVVLTLALLVLGKLYYGRRARRA